MIRILHVVHALTRGGGLSNFIMNYYRKINKDEVQFDFIYFKDVENDFKDEIESLGGRYFKWNEPALDLKYKREATAFFQEHRGEFTAMHCHALFSFAAYANIARQNGVQTIVAHSHNTVLGNQGIFRKLRNQLFVLCCRYRSDYKFACSEDAAIFMFGKKQYQSGKVSIIENAIDCDKYWFNPKERGTVREEFGLDGKFVVGHIGGFAKQKNHEFLVDLFYDFQKQNPNSTLLLVGGEGVAQGSTLNEIKNKVKKLGMEDKVIYTGIRKDVNRLLMGMDVFVFPSINEGLGIAMVEAQASGLPCIASTAVPNEVKCVDSAYFLPLDNKQEWLDMLLSLKTTSRIVEPSLFDKYNINYQASILETKYKEMALRKG